MAKWHKSCYSVRSDSFLGLPMSIRIDDVVGVHAHALQVRMQRSEILAANLANVDTPGFQLAISISPVPCAAWTPVKNSAP